MTTTESSCVGKGRQNKYEIASDSLKDFAKKEDIFEIINRIDASQRAQARIMSQINILLAETKSLKFQVRENGRR